MTRVSKTELLHPWKITGFIDAEGSFVVTIVKDTKRTSGYNVTVLFEIGLNSSDKLLLTRIKNTLGAGNIYYKASDNTYRWKISNIDDLVNVIIPHLKKYPLLTQKRADFELFTKIVEIMQNKGHTTIEGLQQIINLKASLNLGLSDKLKADFPNTEQVPRPKVSISRIPDPNWIAGFASGEACFFISIYKSEKSKLKLAVQLVLKITQHSRDRELLKSIKDYFSCGRVENRKTEACDFTVNSFKSFNEIIIPFFEEYKIEGIKYTNYEYFKEIVEIMRIKGHLIPEGLERIKEIKSCTRRAFGPAGKMNNYENI